MADVPVTDASLRATIVERLAAVHVEVTDMSGTLPHLGVQVPAEALPCRLLTTAARRRGRARERRARRERGGRLRVVPLPPRSCLSRHLDCDGARSKFLCPRPLPLLLLSSPLSSFPPPPAASPPRRRMRPSLRHPHRFPSVPGPQLSQAPSPRQRRPQGRNRRHPRLDRKVPHPGRVGARQGRRRRLRAVSSLLLSRSLDLARWLCFCFRWSDESGEMGSGLCTGLCQHLLPTHRHGWEAMAGKEVHAESRLGVSTPRA